MYNLIGKTLAHSYSKEIHQSFGMYDYELKNLPDEEAVRVFLRDGDFEGLNVTIPYKQTVIPCLAALSDEARRIGSVNTVVRRGGKLYGYNTDYAGFSAMAARAGIFFSGKTVVILGSGGTSLTARCVAAGEGAASVTVVSRKGPVTYDDLPRLAHADILINTTPVGMYPETDKTPVDLSVFDNLSGVIDVIYNPLRTRLVQAAEERGIPATGGLFMLLWQAAEACRLFTGKAPASPDRAYGSLLADKTTVVLIGMPGSGKSTVAALLADAMGRTVLDCDEELVRAAGMPIPEIFATQGEAAFRELETRVICDLSRRAGVILSTGGGCVLRRENLPPLRQNGRIYRLTRPVQLLDRAGRPLSLSGDLADMERQREPFYRAFADCTVENTGTPQQAADAILEDFYAHFGIERPQPQPAGHP